MAWPFVLKNMKKNPSYTETPYSVGDSIYDCIRFCSPAVFGGKCRLKSKVQYSFRLRISKINEINFLFILKKLNHEGLDINVLIKYRKLTCFFVFGSQIHDG